MSFYTDEGMGVRAVVGSEVVGVKIENTSRGLDKVFNCNILIGSRKTDSGRGYFE